MCPPRRGGEQTSFAMGRYTEKLGRHSSRRATDWLTSRFRGRRGGEKRNYSVLTAHCGAASAAFGSTPQRVLVTICAMKPQLPRTPFYALVNGRETVVTG